MYLEMPSKMPAILLSFQGMYAHQWVTSAHGHKVGTPVTEFEMFCVSYLSDHFTHLHQIKFV